MVDDLDRSLPDKTYATSRRLRLFTFSLVTSALVVSLLIITIQFVWNEFFAPALERAPYNPRVEFILPAILIIAYLLHRVIWDAAEGTVRVRRPGKGPV